MIYPKFIKEKDIIGVPAPSDGAKDNKKTNKYNNAKNNIEKLGFNLELSNNLYNSIKGRSSSENERAQEINEMISNKDIKTILCASGGDFLIEILPYIDFRLIKENPKWIVGFSDPTGILYPITTKYDVATIYGNNFSPFGMEKLHNSQKVLIEILKGNIIEQKNYDKYEDEYQETITGLEYYNLTKKVEWKTLDNKDVNISGRIIGGCLDIISELAGTKYDGIKEFNERYKEDGIIWYFDNCELSMEETIRVLWKLNELEYFKYTKCIIFGRFGSNITYYDYDVKKCLEDSVINELNIPIIYDADISHKSPCLNIINGAYTNLIVKDGKANVSFELK